MIDREKVLNGLECLAQVRDPVANPCRNCGYADRPNYAMCVVDCSKDALELLNEQDEIIDALLKVGYPHNFQRESPWIVNYMRLITDVVKKAVHLRNGEVKQDG